MRRFAAALAVSVALFLSAAPTASAHYLDLATAYEIANAFAYDQDQVIEAPYPYTAACYRITRYRVDCVEADSDDQPLTPTSTVWCKRLTSVVHGRSGRFFYGFYESPYCDHTRRPRWPDPFTRDAVIPNPPPPIRLAVLRPTSLNNYCLPDDLLDQLPGRPRNRYGVPKRLLRRLPGPPCG
jgi:hypothetical protein